MERIIINNVIYFSFADHNRVSGSRHPLNAGDTALNGKTEVAKAAPTAPALAQLPPHLLKELKHASAGCEAMAVLVQYLVHSVRQHKY
jgi:hypothetical protein